MEIIYSELPVRIFSERWAPGQTECQSCGVKLTPGMTGNVAWCDFHDQTCDHCDDDLNHPHGRTA